MRKVFSLALLSVFLACLPNNLSAQDEFPVVVISAQSEVTVFTNYQMIRLTYTVGYLDGYLVRFEEAEPANMSFGLAIDQEKGARLIRLNKRRYKNENYEDLVYYLRHIGEKKGEITIPEQVFRYIKEEPGRLLEGQIVREIKSPEMVIRYGSVLTEKADDIMDVIDFGSFQKQEKIWKGLSIGWMVLTVLGIALIWYWPVLKQKTDVRTLRTAEESADTLITERQLVPEEVLGQFIDQLQEKKLVLGGLISIDSDLGAVIDHEERAKLANGLKNLLRTYDLAILDSDTPAEIELKIMGIAPYEKRQKSLATLASQLVYHDGVLFGKKPAQNLSADLRDTLLACQDLQRADSWWQWEMWRERLKFKLWRRRR